MVRLRKAGMAVAALVAALACLGVPEAALAMDFGKECLGFDRDIRPQVQAVGVFEGGNDVSFEIGRSGRETRGVNVVVQKRETPVVLVLTAFDPVIWSIGDLTDGKIVGVYVMGYHSQAVRGLAGQTPVTILSAEDGGPTACGAYALAHTAGWRLENLDRRLRQLFGRSVASFDGGYRRRHFSIHEAETTGSLEAMPGALITNAQVAMKDKVGSGAYVLSSF